MFEFNPKGHSLLDEQLAESGLEMNIVIAPAVAAALIGGGTSILGGIMGSKSASDQNAQAQSNYQAQLKAAQAAADAQNEYNKRAFEVEKQNYQNYRRYEWDTAVKSWQYNQEVQDFQYLQTVKQFGKSVENTQDQLTYNNIAAMQASEAEQAALNEIMNETAFTMQGSLVEQLQSEGRASLLQAGGSRKKALQSTIASIGRDAAVMDASLSSSVEQMRRNMRDISLRKYGADVQAKASMMIQPEALPDIPVPTQAPERIFIEPMKVMPGAVQAPAQQSTMAPLISGFTSAAGMLASANWGNNYKTQLNVPSGTGSVGIQGFQIQGSLL
jgi:hypothetical protein